MSAQYGYARMPRIIRKGYKHLTKLQKLLYIYLRDLCGENGTCYRSLRSLAEETDFSIGYLSENIPLLEKAGLIQAEKKKRNGKKWEAWHINIVDIWEQNAHFIQTEKCSSGEQNNENCSHDEQNHPETVHGMNEIGQKCSRGANKRESVMTNNPLPTEKERRLTLTPIEQAFHSLYQSSSLAAQKNVTSKIKEQYAELAPEIQTQEQLKSLHVYAKDRIRGDNKTVYLGNLINSLPGWKQQQEMTPSNRQQTEGEIETVAEEIQATGLVMRTGEDEYGAYIEVLYGDDKDSYWLIRSPEEWNQPGRYEQKMLTQCREYARQPALAI